MSRKNKTLRAFLHQNENPTIQQAWDHAWKSAQKKFHARSMQDMEARIGRLVEMVRALAYDYHNLTGGEHHEAAHELLAALEAEKGGGV